jgi:hypothetical protein
MRRIAHALVVLCAVAIGAGALTATEPAAEPVTAAAYCSGVDVADLRRPYSFRYGLTGDELQSGFFASGALGSQGYRPRRLTGYRAGSQQLFATKWVQTPGPEWYARFGLTSSEFGTVFQQRRAAWRPIDVSGYTTPGGALRHAVIWERNTPRVDWRLHRDVSRAGMDDLVDEYAKSGFVPLRVEAYPKSGELRYVSIWVKTACSWRMHNRMSRSEYQSKLDAYAGSHRLVHLDAFANGARTSYAGIWWRQPGPGQDVRSDRDWYAFQRVGNNNVCQGRVIDNFYAADVPGAIRYGGIWTATGAPQVGSLESRIRQEVNCTPARAGAAILNLTTGQQILVHADVAYGTSSTIKSAILYALLKKIDATPATLDSMLGAGSVYGTERGTPTFQPRQRYSLRTFATKMIRSSCNWSTNRLIDYVGMAQVNEELRTLGIDDVTLRRYMTGTGAPSPRRGSTGPSDDYGDGIDNTATPREYASFIRLMHENAGKLTRGSLTFFWQTLGLNGSAHDGVLDAGVSNSRLAIATLAEKAGSNTWSAGPSSKPQLSGTHYQRSVAGRMTVANGPVVVYAAFADEGTATSSTPLQNMLDCVVMHAMREYTGRTTGADVAACAAG